jgi:hypothetical protein
MGYRIYMHFGPRGGVDRHSPQPTTANETAHRIPRGELPLSYLPVVRLSGLRTVLGMGHECGDSSDSVRRTRLLDHPAPPNLCSKGSIRKCRGEHHVLCDRASDVIDAHAKATYGSKKPPLTCLPAA